MSLKPTSNITPIKIGLKFTPPSLLLIYNDKSKLRSRTIPVKNLDILTDLRLFTEKFKSNEKYRKYFDKIDAKKLEKQFFILQDFMKGYTLTESLERAKKYDNSANVKSDFDELDLTNDGSSHGKKSANDINDFRDTDEEDDKNSSLLKLANKQTNAGIFSKQSLTSSTTTTANANNGSKASALDLLSTQLKSVKANIFDFEEEVEDEMSNRGGANEDDDDDDDKNILNFATKTKKEKEEKIEIPKNDDDSSDSSF